MEKLETSYIRGRYAEWCSPFEKYYSGSLNRVTLWAGHSSLMSISKSSENMYPHKTLYTNVHSSIVHESQPVEAI